MGAKKEFRNRNVRRSIYFSFLCLLIVSCANMGSPDGGPYDETPPQIIRTSPGFGALGAKSRKIVLEFDEIVKLDNAQAVVVSPPQLEAPEIEAYGRKVTVTLSD